MRDSDPVLDQRVLGRGSMQTDAPRDAEGKQVSNCHKSPMSVDVSESALSQTSSKRWMSGVPKLGLQMAAQQSKIEKISACDLYFPVRI